MKRRMVPCSRPRIHPAPARVLHVAFSARSDLGLAFLADIIADSLVVERVHRVVVAWMGACEKILVVWWDKKGWAFFVGEADESVKLLTNCLAWERTPAVHVWNIETRLATPIQRYASLGERTPTFQARQVMSNAEANLPSSTLSSLVQ